MMYYYLNMFAPNQTPTNGDKLASHSQTTCDHAFCVKPHQENNVWKSDGTVICSAGLNLMWSNNVIVWTNRYETWLHDFQVWPCIPKTPLLTHAGVRTPEKDTLSDLTLPFFLVTLHSCSCTSCSIDQIVHLPIRNQHIPGIQCSMQQLFAETRLRIESTTYQIIWFQKSYQSTSPFESNDSNSSRWSTRSFRSLPRSCSMACFMTGDLGHRPWTRQAKWTHLQWEYRPRDSFKSTLWQLRAET